MGLTDEAKESLMAAYVKKWIDIGICTQPADRPMAEEGIREMYQASGLGDPEIIWVSSPKAMKDLAKKMGDPDPCEKIRWGQFDAACMAKMDLAVALKALDCTVEYLSLVKIAESAGPFLTYTNTVIICERPWEVHGVRTPELRVIYRDGTIYGAKYRNEVDG